MQEGIWVTATKFVVTCYSHHRTLIRWVTWLGRCQSCSWDKSSPQGSSLPQVVGMEATAVWGLVLTLSPSTVALPLTVH